MAGRKKDYVWQDVTLTEDDKASCNYCDAVISKRPIRIKDCLKKCRKIQPTESKILLYFHTLSSSLYLVFNIHYYIIT